MLLIDCPYCGQERAEIEFTCAGEAHMHKPDDADDAHWEKFLFMRANTKGVHFERWYHIHGCGRYFNAVRDTISEKISLTYKAGEKRPNKSMIAKGFANKRSTNESGNR